MDKAVLTFTMSVADKKVFKDTYFQNEWYQIMPSTSLVLTESAIDNYPKISNPKILIHMNYLTHCFSEEAIEKNSKARYSLKLYNKLADKLGTKNILIHMPSSLDEFKHLDYGLNIINEELIRHGKILQFEITSWSKTLQNYFKLREAYDEDLKAKGEYHTHTTTTIQKYIDMLISRIEKIDGFKFQIVFDTAHLYSIGLDGHDMVLLMKPYIEFGMCTYVHLNGNTKPKFSTDTHTGIFGKDNKFIDTMHHISKYCSENKLICVIESTQVGYSWEIYEKFAKTFNYRLVTPSDCFMH